MGGNRGRDEIFGVECCVTLHCDWPIFKVRKIGRTELGQRRRRDTGIIILVLGFMVT